MGACYSYEEDWQEEQIKVSVRKRQRKKKKTHHSIIVEEKSVGGSFASVLDCPFRQSLHETIDCMVANKQSIMQASMAMGSIVEMTPEEHEQLLQHLTHLHKDSDEHTVQMVRFCNFKTKNFLHTHKIKLQGKAGNLQEVSCCPYNSGHTLQYDVWQLIPAPGGSPDQFSLFHPFTAKYLSVEGETVCCKSEQFTWTLQCLGKRRNSGFLRIECQQGYLCMTDEKALIKNHRSLNVCKNMHISHIWELIFTDCI